MNYAFANSECSIGCESGWTSYLEPSSSSFFQYSVSKKLEVKDEEEEENEDLSMVSDASSGPPHFHEENEFYRATVDATLSRPNMKKKDKEIPRRKVQEQPSLLDDTASSPIFDYSEKNFSLPNVQASVTVENALEYSQGYSTTQFEGRSTYQEHYDFFQSSLYANQQQKIQLEWSEGKRI